MLQLPGPRPSARGSKPSSRGRNCAHRVAPSALSGSTAASAFVPRHIEYDRHQNRADEIERAADESVDCAGFVPDQTATDIASRTQPAAVPKNAA